MRDADDCRQTDGGDVREETVVGNAWRKPRQPRNMAMLLSHA